MLVFSYLLHPIWLCCDAIMYAEPKLMIFYRENTNTGLAYTKIAVLFVTLALAYNAPSCIELQTIWHSFLFGLCDPIIGVEYLSFLIAFGLMIAFLKNRMNFGAFFIVATKAGTLILLAGGFLPMTELVISASIALSDFLIMHGRDVKLPTVVALALFSGLFHSLAFSAAVIGSELSPTIAYLFGLAVVHMGVVYGTAFFFYALWKATEKLALKRRSSEAFEAGGGLIYIRDHSEGVIVNIFRGRCGLCRPSRID